jgi:hypothetical protein
MVYSAIQMNNTTLIVKDLELLSVSLSHYTECHGRVVSIPVSYFEGLWLKS